VFPDGGPGPLRDSYSRSQIDLLEIRIRALEIQVKRLQKHRPLSDNYIILEANP